MCNTHALVRHLGGADVLLRQYFATTILKASLSTKDW